MPRRPSVPRSATGRRRTLPTPPVVDPSSVRRPAFGMTPLLGAGTSAGPLGGDPLAPTPAPRAVYGFDRAAGRYRAPSGRFVAQRDITKSLDTFLQTEERRAVELTNALRRGEITLQEWQGGMAQLIKETQLAGGALAKGGWAEMTAGDYARIAGRIRFNYGKLRAFARDLETGAVPADGRILQRAGLYVRNTRRTFQQIRREEAIVRGATEVRSIRHASDSCAGCLDMAALGWTDPVAMILPGDRDCLGNCLCDLEYR